MTRTRLRRPMDRETAANRIVVRPETLRHAGVDDHSGAPAVDVGAREPCPPHQPQPHRLGVPFGCGLVERQQRRVRFRDITGHLNPGWHTRHERPVIHEGRVGDARFTRYPFDESSIQSGRAFLVGVALGWRIDSHRESPRGLESQIDRENASHGLQQRSRANEQRDGNGELQHDQRSARPRSAIPAFDAGVSQILQSAARHPPRRNRADHHPRNNTQHGGEQHGLAIEPEFANAWDSSGCEGTDDREEPGRAAKGDDPGERREGQ